MAGTTQATVAVATPAFAKRKARALIGWLPEQEGALWISGRQMQLVPDPAHIGLCQSARALVAARPVGLDQTGFAVDVPTVLHDHIGSIRAHPWSAQALLDAGEPRLVDLRKIRAVQPVIHVEDAIKRVESISAADLLGIARVTLPIPPPTPPELPAAFDPVKQTHIFSSANPNLRVLGHFSGIPIQGPGGVVVLGFGFIVAQTISYLCVGGVNGRYFLRDGYHRAYGLLKAGVTHAPALVRDFGSVEEAKLPTGMLPVEAFMGDRPPTLEDYLDDAVGVDTFAPLTTKMIVIQALKLTPLN